MRTGHQGKHLAKSSGSIMQEEDMLLGTMTTEIDEVKREITFTAYGGNLENTIRLLKSNKNLNLLEQKNDVRAKRFFVTTFASRQEHREFFGSTRR